MRSERGYTLVEAMFVCVLLVLVLGATLALLDTTAQVAPAENERAHAVREAQQQLDAMVRELRQAREVFSVTPTRIEARVPLVGGQLRKVVYDCNVQPSVDPKPGTSICERQLYTADGTAVERKTTAIARVLDSDGPAAAGPAVFEATEENGETVYVKTTIAVPASGTRTKGHEHEIVLNQGFLLRNVNE